MCGSVGLGSHAGAGQLRTLADTHLCHALIPRLDHLQQPASPLRKVNTASWGGEGCADTPGVRAPGPGPA